MEKADGNTKNRGTVLYRKLLSLFFVALLPFFILSLQTNQIAEKRLREQSESRMMSRMAIAASKYEQLYMDIGSWMNVNLMGGYKPLLANDSVSLSSYRLGQLVAELYGDILKLMQISDEIDDIAVYMPGTGRKVSLKKYYANILTEQETERLDAYQDEMNYFVYVQDAFRIQSSSLRFSEKPPAYA